LVTEPISLGRAVLEGTRADGRGGGGRNGGAMEGPGGIDPFQPAVATAWSFGSMIRLSKCALGL